MIKFNGRQILKNGWGINYTEPPEPPGLSLLPMSSWTIAPKSITNNTVWVTDNNTVHINGVGDWNELIYTTYTPAKNVQYELTVKWNAPSLDFWNSQASTSLRQLGVWFDTELNLYRTNSYEGSMSQGVLMYDHDTLNPVSIEGTSTINLTAGTTYYVWISLGTLEDYKEQTISFTDIRLKEL